MKEKYICLRCLDFSVCFIISMNQIMRSRLSVPSFLVIVNYFVCWYLCNIYFVKKRKQKLKRTFLWLLFLWLSPFPGSTTGKHQRMSEEVFCSRSSLPKFFIIFIHFNRLSSVFFTPNAILDASFIAFFSTIG